jgi:hypothetical protein
MDTLVALALSEPPAEDDPAIAVPAPDHRRTRRGRPRGIVSCRRTVRSGKSSFFEAAQLAPLLKLACAATPGDRESATQFDLALRAWRKGQQLEEAASDGAANAFTLLSGLPGEQMRTLHAHPDRPQRRALERLLISPWGGAETQCRNCPTRTRLSAFHLDSCGGQPLIAAMRVGDWLSAGPALCSALYRCRRDTASQSLKTVGFRNRRPPDVRMSR